jgi:hypothetical protein
VFMSVLLELFLVIESFFREAHSVYVNFIRTLFSDGSYLVFFHVNYCQLRRNPFFNKNILLFCLKKMYNNIQEFQGYATHFPNYLDNIKDKKVVLYGAKISMDDMKK